MEVIEIMMKELVTSLRELVDRSDNILKGYLVLERHSQGNI